jgi:phage/plasmid primase-like uncharacterized protein
MLNTRGRQSSIRNSHWRRVSKREPCPICGKTDWCLIGGPVGDPDVAICPRIKSATKIDKGGKFSGWLHRLRESTDSWWTSFRSSQFTLKQHQPQTSAEWNELAHRFVAATSPGAMSNFADNLGLSVESLRRLRTGWVIDRRAWSFPMQDASGNVAGIRLRLSNGRKFAVKGGSDGLFIPAGLPESDRLLIAEGPTDTAALLDLGFAVVGRPNCSGGAGLIVGLLKRRNTQDVAIVADGDAPGRRGAEDLASILAAYTPTVRIIVPPAGVKDARQWRQAGVTHGDIQAAIDAAPVKKLTVHVKCYGR